MPPVLIGLLCLLGGVILFAVVAVRVNRFVYGAEGASRKHAHTVAVLLGVVVAVGWLVGWALSLALLDPPTGRWLWVCITLLAIAILNGLRSDFRAEEKEFQKWLSSQSGGR